MDLEAVRKSLSKRATFSQKQLAFFAIAAMILVVGISLRAMQYFGQSDTEQTAPVTEAAPPAPATPAAEPESVAKTPPAAQDPVVAPKEQAEQTGEAAEQVDEADKTDKAAEQADEPLEQAEEADAPAEQAEQADTAAKQADEEAQRTGQSELPGSGKILVSRQPVEVRSSPSSSAPVMYGFPAGRPFRVISRQGDFAQIKDLRSGASGWIEEAALAPPPPRAPPAAAPSQRAPVGRRAAPPPAGSARDSQVTAETEAPSEPAQTRRRPGLFGGLFGGIFGN